MNPEEPKQLEIASFAAHSTRGLIRERKTRRAIMLAAIVVAVALVVLGSLLPREHLVLALAAWFGCAWMTITAVLLAIYDLLAVRREARDERDRLQRRMQ